MLKNYFITAWRYLVKQKMYAAIKVGGFALGIAACFLISLYIQEELSYDRHIPNADRIYRTIVEYNDPGAYEKGVHFPAPFAKTLKEDFPEIEKAGRLNASSLFGAGSAEIRRADQPNNSYEEGITYADQELVDILRLPMIYGNAKQALAEPNTIIISQRKADKFFPHENPVGKTLILNDNVQKPYKIGAVMQDMPATSHLQYDFLLTLQGVELFPGEQTSWRNKNYITYILLRPGADALQLEKKLTRILERHVVPILQAEGNAEALISAKNTVFQLQALRDIHLKYDGIPDSWTKYGDVRFVYLFGAIAAFILIIACINFINLSTAKSANRAKEVGLRKVLGSYRSSLIKQFLTESLLYSVISFGVGLFLAWLLLPYFNQLAAKTLVIPWRAWWLLPTLLAAASIIGVVAGVYPAFYLSAFQPVSVLKGAVSRGSKSSGTRSFLVVFQFTTSIVLIVGTFIIYRQMNYILHKEIGFEKDQVILLQGTNTLGKKVKTLKTELLRLPEVKNVSISDYLPISGTNRNGNPFWEEGKTVVEKAVDGQLWVVDQEYVKTLGMKMTVGRDFSQDLASDSQAVVVNQALVQKFNFAQPIGQRITNGGQTWTIIGVVEDFHYETFKREIEPICLTLGNSPSVVAVKVNTPQMAKLVQDLTTVWKRVAPHQPIRFSFLDESYARMYEEVERMGQIFSSFAVLAIIVACLGLFALSAYMVEQRSKEISIRLVLGASTFHIFRLLTQNFLKLVLTALIIAVPIAWYGMQTWLQDYEYRVAITWDVFIVAGILTVCIAVLTISYQTFRAAFTKPVKALRNE
ncbi:ABC transporter permease [Adhaeribacter pallidiroseus]|uniref:Macrolide export ATP-binding/permease protein MacB n=1 Tax=Adhaeribacter pallidiroseus TaxID=2072847 RepID=A0A369QKK7_9BACT|nr:ABC transporter permease [Adhaeribacter pallidiroseus]RDC65453.1 Macrolide export ATP-binding/permease protein MacB [Adhaeribacter pallidiroseus]